MVRFISLFSGVLTCVLLSACSTVTSSNFRELSSAYRGVIEQYTNDNILLNIVRTSKNMPMSFLDIPTVVGSGSLTAEAGISSGSVASANPASFTGFFSAAPGTTYSPRAVMGVSNSYTFTQASLDNSQFMQAFLKEVPLETINFRGTEASLPKMVLYSLLIDTIQIRSDRNQILATWKNDPLNPNYQEFQSLLYLLVDLGLKTEVKSETEPVGPLMSEQDALKNMSSYMDAISKPGSGMALVKKIANGKTYYQLARSSSYTRACVNKYLTQKIVGVRLTAPSYCDDSPVTLEPVSGKHAELLSKLQTHDMGLNLFIRLRSTGNVFNYLGDVLNAQMDPTNPYLVTIKSNMSPDGKKLPGNSEIEYSLFKVYKNKQANDPVYSVEYRGDVYTVSADSDTFTSKVLEFVSTLITANKLPGTAPPTPAIVIR